MTTKDPIIAVINDDPAGRRTLARILTTAGYPTLVFTSAEEFLRCAVTSNAACLVIDLNFGETSGAHLICNPTVVQLRVPVILMTESVDAPRLLEAGARHASILFPKPFHATDLLSNLATVLRSAGDAN